MIFFNCPDCKEELEAEESIRGVKMLCPACEKEISVPQATTRPTTRTTRKDLRNKSAPYSSALAAPGGKFILWVLLAGTLGIVAIAGVGIALTNAARERALLARPQCAVCSTKGTVDCVACKGTSKRDCIECLGVGTRTNFRGDEERCFACSGKKQVDCPVCGGRGKYSCAGCNGVGYLRE